MFLQCADIVAQYLTSYVKREGWEDYIEEPVRYFDFKSQLFRELMKYLISSQLGSIRYNGILNSLYMFEKIPSSAEERNWLTEYQSSISQIDISDIESFRDIESFYESLVSVDFVLCRGEILAELLHKGRNIQGAYFTPEQLALSCTRRAVSDLVRKKLGVDTSLDTFSDLRKQSQIKVFELLSTIKIADVSSGVGRFLVAYVEVVRELLQASNSSKTVLQSYLAKAISNITAIDIDYLALDIARLCVYEASGYKQLPESSSFVLANPLLDCGGGDTVSRMISFSRFDFYNQSLGIRTSQFEDSFDLIIGNPPWEKIRLEEKSFFITLVSSHIRIDGKRERLKAISVMGEKAPQLYEHYTNVYSSYQNAKVLVKKSQYFQKSSKGELNTYSLFAELSLALVSQPGLVAILVKSGILTTAVNKAILQKLVRDQVLFRVADYVNSRKIFAIDGRERFCLLVLSSHKKKSFLYSGLNTNINDVENSQLYWAYPYSALAALNPDTRMMTTFSGKLELEFSLSVSEKNELFGDVFSDANFGRIVHYTNHSSYIDKVSTKGNIGILEGKFIERYNGRFSTYENVSNERRYVGKASARPLTAIEQQTKIPEPRYFIREDKWKELSKRYKGEFALMWRSVSSNTNRRSCIATLLNFQPASQSVQFLQLPEMDDLILALSVMNSFTFDYFLRRKMSGIDVTQTIIKQIPVPALPSYEEMYSALGVRCKAKEMLFSLVYLLLKHESRLENFWNNVDSSKGLDVEPDEAERILDVLIAKLYGLNEQDYELILRDFSRRNDTESYLAAFSNVIKV
jgi:hypothetical protein